MSRIRPLLLAPLFAFAVVATACGSSAPSASSATTSTGGTATALHGSITVSAAASLTEAFTTIGHDFEQAHPGTTVTLTFDSSGTLSQQILDGAPVDVFASADEANAQKVVDAHLATGAPATFARNELVIVTKPGNPKGIESLADLPGAGVVALCAETAPCGTFASKALDQANVSLDESSITRGQNVKATLTAVTEGDAVAGIVYVTDARAAGDRVDTVAIPADQNVIATYPSVVIAGSKHRALAEAFASYLTGDEAQAALADRGFLPAP